MCPTTCRCADMQQALTRCCRTWLVSMPVMAAQLVLATAAENGSLVMDDRFAQHLPLVRRSPLKVPTQSCICVRFKQLCAEVTRGWTCVLTFD